MSTIIKKSSNNLIAVTIGDIEGIGINLLIKEWLRKKVKNFILITNIEIFNSYFTLSKNKINLIKGNNFEDYNKKKLNILSFNTKNKYSNKLDSLNIAYKQTKDKKFLGILTLPVNKEKINKYVNKKFIDQTSYFSNLEKKEGSMIFIYNKKFFVPLTTHIEIKNVYKFFKKKSHVIHIIKGINDTLKKDFKIKKPRLIISGINPHAGENGLISKDEKKYLKPIINDLLKKDINITGPVSGDGIVNNLNLDKYDAFIFTFHDQALIPFKIISNYKGVNFTSNLNIIRISPSHGTAENLVNSKIASSNGILSSFKIIRQISKNRK